MTEERLRIILWSLVGIVLIAAVAVNVIEFRKLHDIRLVNEVKMFAIGLEQYYEDFWRYPAGQFDLRQGAVLTENGLAQGSRIYYQGRVRASRQVSYESNGRTYEITFRLKAKWEKLGFNAHGIVCKVQENMRYSCAE